MKKSISILAVVFALSALTFAETIHKGNPYGAGTVGATTQVGANISINAQELVSGKTVDVVCKVTSYSSDASGNVWTCSQGDTTGVFVDEIKVSDVVRGKMASSCYSMMDTTVCGYSIEIETPKGTIYASAAGNQYIPNITFFEGVW